MTDLLTFIEKTTGEAFQHPALLHNALTHRSFINENSEIHEADNERLEFLGDAVLGLIVSQELMKQFPTETEGNLSKYRSSLVNEKILSKIAFEIDLNKYIRLGKGEDKNEGRKKPSILADTFEAIIAAIFLSNGFECASSFVLTAMTGWIEEVQRHSFSMDFKSQLQEYALKEYKMTPHYVLVNQEGPDHFKTFETKVIINDIPMGIGKGRSKKDSEQMAAKKALRFIQQSESSSCQK